MSLKNFIPHVFLIQLGLFLLMLVGGFASELRVQHDNDLPAGAVPITDEDVYKLVKPEPAELTQENLEQINQLGFDMTLPTQVMDFNAKKDEISEKTDFKLPTRVIIPVTKKPLDESQLEPPVQETILPSTMIPKKQAAEVFYIDGKEEKILEDKPPSDKKVNPPPKKEEKKKKKRKRRKRRR